MDIHIITVHLIMTGQVQGVAYRESMRAVAQALGVNGWVRNRVDGSVEATVQGTAHDVERLVAWCHNGPPNARVQAIKSTLLNPTGELPAFDKFARWPSV